MCESCKDDLKLNKCLSCAEGKCTSCEDGYVLQPNGTCIKEFVDCLVEPQFYLTTQDLKLACPLCDTSKGLTFDLKNQICESCSKLGCLTCNNLGRCLTCDTTKSFLYDGVCVTIDKNCHSLHTNEYVLVEDHLECPVCKDANYKDEKGVCSLNCKDKFPNCDSCSDDGLECYWCSFGYHLGLYSNCYENKVNNCPVVNGNQHWYNSETRKCQECSVYDCLFCGNTGRCEECKPGFFPSRQGL